MTAASAVLARFVRELDAQAPMAVDARPDLSRGSPADLDAARAAWTSRIVDEHRSVVVFGELLVLLGRIGAPHEALAAVQRLIGDELRHARLCQRFARAFGGGDVDVRELGLPASKGSPHGRALAIVVRELVIAETESVHALRAYRDAATDPACRAALSLLLRDEARHAATGRALARELRAAFPASAFGDVPARLVERAAADVAHVRAQHRACAGAGPGRVFGARVLPHELPA